MNEKLQAFYRSMSGKRVAVVGLGISNTPLVGMLLRCGAQVTGFDRRPEAELSEELRALTDQGLQLCCGPDYLSGLAGAQVIFKTPGMRFDLPELEAARAAGAVVTSEMEAFFEVCPCPIVAVTGSDGKSTTTSLCAEILRRAGFTVHLGGNLGEPLLPHAEEIAPTDIAVAELSSFQLHTMRQSPGVAVITNISPNHLDVHRSMEEYVDAKRNIMRWQDETGLLVLNEDDPRTPEIRAAARGRVKTFSVKTENADAFLRADGMLCLRTADGVTELLRREEILLPGLHNVMNLLTAALAVAETAGVAAVRETARTFPGLAHRMELIRERNGVRWYNDSIASSPTRAAACLSCFDKKIILIAGGYDKKIAFDAFGELVARKVSTLILCGATAEKIETAVRAAESYRDGAPVIVHTGTLAEAVEAAERVAVPGDVVALSPACASFDQFKNFEVRGDKFRALVNAL